MRQWQLWFSQAAACEPVEMPAQMPAVPHAHAAAVRMLPTQVEISEMTRTSVNDACGDNTQAKY